MADSPARTTSGAPGGAERRGCGVVHRTTSESLRLGDLALTPSLPGAAPAPLQHNPRKISSFQITSVTVGGRASADGGEDSADDLDESHADDLSRVTDLDNETPSRSEDTFSRDDVFYNASASLSLGSAPVIPTSSQYGLAIVGQEAEAGDMRAAPGGALDTLDAKPQDTKEVQEHVRNERFKVVKIESTEPFRRGRWMCMDYLDHTTTQQSAPIVVNNNLDSTEGNALTADSGVVINDIQHDELTCANDLTNKELQAPPSVLQLEQKSFPMASPGQSLTQPVNLVQQIPAPVSVQSPPLEMPQQMTGQSLQASAQVGQQHPQSMTHITLQNVPPNHPQPTQPQPVQQMPQSFPQHQLQQVIAQSQGMPQMQQMTMHQQIPQQLQQIPNQAQMQQMPQHMPQNQMANMQQMPPQISQMQSMQNQNQMQVQNQNQMQQMQMQMQGQSNPQQMHQMQQAQIPNMNQQTHHLQSQAQSMGSQQSQLQHMSSQAQLQAMQSQQMPNHMQQMQMSGQVNQMANANQQIPQMQPQMHMAAQPTGQQQVVPGMHQMQQGMSGVQPQYNQVNQQTNAQSMISSVIPSSQQTMVSQQHNVPQYHTQQSQISQQGQTLSQEVLTGIATSHQAASMAANLQSLPSQPPGSTLPSNLQAINQQNSMHSMAQQGQSMPQGALQMMTNAPQNMPMSLDANQAGMQLSVSDPIYLQSANQMQMGQHMPQAQNMMPQQVSTGGQAQQHLQQQNQMNAMQYVMPQQQGMPNQANVPNQQSVVSQANMQNVNQQGNVQSMGMSQGQPLMQTMVNQVPHPQNIPMSMQQSHPASMQGTVHGVATSVVQSQTNMQPNMQGMAMGNYGSQAGVSSMPQNVMPVMSHTSMNQPVGMSQQMDTTQVISGTSSPVVSLAVSGAYAMPVNAMEGQNFGSPVSAVVSHVVNSLVNSSVGLTACDSGALEVNETGKSGDTGDGKDDSQPPGVSEDERNGRLTYNLSIMASRVTLQAKALLEEPGAVTNEIRKIVIGNLITMLELVYRSCDARDRLQLELEQTKVKAANDAALQEVRHTAQVIERHKSLEAEVTEMKISMENLKRQMNQLQQNLLTTVGNKIELISSAKEANGRGEDIITSLRQT